MRLLLVNPNTDARTTALMLAIARAAAPPGVTIDSATAATGVPLILDPAMLARAADAVQALLAGMDLAPCGGVIIAAFGNPGRATAAAASRPGPAMPIIEPVPAAVALAPRRRRPAIPDGLPPWCGRQDRLKAGS